MNGSFPECPFLFLHAQQAQRFLVLHLGTMKLSRSKRQKKKLELWFHLNFLLTMLKKWLLCFIITIVFYKCFLKRQCVKNNSNPALKSIHILWDDLRHPYQDEFVYMNVRDFGKKWQAHTHEWPSMNESSWKMCGRPTLMKGWLDWHPSRVFLDETNTSIASVILTKKAQIKSWSISIL